MESIVTYDIPAKHRELKKAMFALGYKDQIPGIKNCKIIYFPNTVLYHASKTAEEAIDDVKATCKSLAVELERCVATKWDDWYAICGEDFK
jgi:hypothetical protein